VKLGLVGDVHAEDERLAAALALFRAEGASRALFVGDLVDGDGDVDRCCALLLAAGALGVRGNHDRWLLEGTMRALPRAHARESLAPQSIALLESLPPTREIDTPRGLLLLCHGVGEDDMQRLGPDDEGYALETNDALVALLRAGRHRFVVGGHTHDRMVRRFATGGGELVFVNAGTLARDSAPCCAVLDLEAKSVRFFDLDDPDAPRPAESLPL
jgi:predicted phosphodiesterase